MLNLVLCVYSPESTWKYDDNDNENNNNFDRERLSHKVRSHGHENFVCLFMLLVVQISLCVYSC